MRKSVRPVACAGVLCVLWIGSDGDPTLEVFLKTSGVAVMEPGQYMDKWRLDRNGVRPVPNTEVKKALGFT